MPRKNKKRKKFGGQSNHPPNKKRRFNNNNKSKLTPEESKIKCLEIIKTLQETVQNESLNLMELKKITEKDVGIKLFLNNNKSKSFQPIIANIKHKWEDFIVKEIDESGNIANITNDQPIKDLNSIADNKSNIQTVNQEMTQIFDQNTTNQFLKWYKNGLKVKHNIDIDIDLNPNDQNKNSLKPNADQENDADIDQKTDKNNQNTRKNAKISAYLFPQILNKEKRTSIHKLLKYLTYIASETDNNSCISVKIIRSAKAQSRWPKDRGAYLKFILTKSGMDTNHCLYEINKKLYLNSNKIFSIAGTKDKHAITSQFITGYHIDSNKLVNAIKPLKNKIKVGNFSYVDQQIKLGNLKGNLFKIAARNVNYLNDNSVPDQDALDERIVQLNQSGFINYFGLQRFGSSTVGTHDIGREIIKNKLKLACALMILPRSNENDLFREKRKLFIESGDINQFPYKLNNEKKIIYSLMQNDNNYEQCFMKLPRNMRMMYIHSYQSYIWNNIVSSRINKYGTDVVIGDLVKIKDMDNSACGDGDGDDNKDNNGGGACGYGYVTSGNIQFYTIFDVVFPIPTSSAKYPKLDITDDMKELLKKDGLELNDFQKLNKSWGLGESYRHIVVKPNNIKGMIKKYNNDDQLLIDTIFNVDNNNNNDDVDNKKTGWVIEFELLKSCYGTMCVRQLLFISSSKLKR